MRIDKKTIQGVMGLNEEGQVKILKENTGQKVKNTTKAK